MMKIEMISSNLNSAIEYTLGLLNIEVIVTWAIRRFMRGLMLFLKIFVIPYSRMKTLKIPNTQIPQMQNKLLEIPAVKLADMIRKREVTSEAVVIAYIERCKVVNPFLNAIVESRYDQALEEARAIDQFLSTNERSLEDLKHEMPLLGVPITVKESISVKGMSNHAGRVHKEKFIAREDAPSVKQVRKNGGVIILVSNTPELCMNFETYNNIQGETKNPYNLKRTSGGSSGGEAALLGSGASLVSMSSDIAGSCRLPAMFCGVFGHKPSPLVVSPLGHIPGCASEIWGQYFTIAPMTRYASDLPLMLRCMRDPDGPSVQLDKPVNVSDIKYYFMEDDGPSGFISPLKSDMHEAFRKVTDHFKAKQVNISKLKWSLDISLQYMLNMENIETIYYKTDNGEEPKSSREIYKYLVGRSVHTFTSISILLLQHLVKYIPKKRQQKLENIKNGLTQQFKELLDTNGVFIYPTFTSSAHRHYEIFYKILDANYTMVFNTLGFPVTNCMIGFDSNNMPIGLQVVSIPGQDHLTLAVAQEIEKAFGGWRKSPLWK